MPWHLLWAGGSKREVGQLGDPGPPISTCSCGGGGCGGLHPVTQKISKVLSVHPTLDVSLSRGPRSPVAPVVGGGQCSLWPVLHQVLESSSSSFKASHLKSVSGRLDPLGASHLCPMRLRPHTPGLGLGCSPGSCLGCSQLPGRGPAGPAPVTCPWRPASAAPALEAA